ncbi:MAG: Gfo/Idh/MocA family oxidoreductase [Lentisphaerae bacterium]|nr:Gfo/Idh/MocA family oxidoreductase [Lentisphaerota bacterium]
MQRIGIAGKISICALNNGPLRELKDNAEIKEAFPGQYFIPYPSFDNPADRKFPDLFKKVLSEMPPRQAVIVAVPDQFHYDIVMEALKFNQHILCVKPLVLKHAQAMEIEKLALKKGLFVGIEYHKRFDRRSLMAKRQYAKGHFGDFAMGEAKLVEPYYYRHSNFQNWFTADQTDPFVYVGCHYVDLVYFITGLKPVEISVSGIKGKFPNGNEGFMWANGRVRYENGAILSVIDGLGYPDAAAGSNDQCLVMYCEGKGKTGLIEHDDQDRGVKHTYLEGIGCAGSMFNYVSPDFYRLVPWEGKGFKPIGYGYDSVAASIERMHKIETETAGLEASESLKVRQSLIKETDERGIIATPANSFINELVVEAARLSIMNDGEWAKITYGKNPTVKLRNS